MSNRMEHYVKIKTVMKDDIYLFFRSNIFKENYKKTSAKIEDDYNPLEISDLYHYDTSVGRYNKEVLFVSTRIISDENELVQFFTFLAEWKVYCKIEKDTRMKEIEDNFSKFLSENFKQIKSSGLFKCTKKFDYDFEMGKKYELKMLRNIYDEL